MEVLMHQVSESIVYLMSRCKIFVLSLVIVTAVEAMIRRVS